MHPDGKERGPDPGPPPWAARERLHIALGRLAMDTRILLELRYYDQMSTRELFAIYRRPHDRIRHMLREARSELEAQLAGRSDGQ